MKPVLSQINVYPVKSLGGCSLGRSQVDRLGLQFDRGWMVVDEQGQFLTQRELPRMALVKVELGFMDFKISLPDGQSRGLHFEGLTHEFFTHVQVWGETCDAFDQGDEVALMLSEFLGRRCRLVRMSTGFQRLAREHQANQRIEVAFADAYPLLVISEASLEDLNARLAEPVPMKRFRPNLVIRGCVPFEEDRWTSVRIGSVELQAVKPCARCKIITTDQDTAEVGKEPLRTLSTYRRVGKHVNFGMNYVHLNEGALSVGDEVEVR